MKTKILILALALVFTLVVSGLALANGVIELPRGVLGGGVTDATGGDLAVRATLGQPVVGVVSGGEFTLGQGFWHGGSLPEEMYGIFLPLLEK